ncbi:MAG: hypothetical protein LBL34_02795 [Clostridiales bacterium]|jgi:hypothetical protein|nr:hypothetical protein [Clostridiales bacterium]
MSLDKTAIYDQIEDFISPYICNNPNYPGWDHIKLHNELKSKIAEIKSFKASTGQNGQYTIPTKTLYINENAVENGKIKPEFLAVLGHETFHGLFDINLRKFGGNKNWLNEGETQRRTYNSVVRYNATHPKTPMKTKDGYLPQTVNATLLAAVVGEKNMNSYANGNEQALANRLQSMQSDPDMFKFYNTMSNWGTCLFNTVKALKKNDPTDARIQKYSELLTKCTKKISSVILVGFHYDNVKKGNPILLKTAMQTILSTPFIEPSESMPDAKAYMRELYEDVGKKALKVIDLDDTTVGGAVYKLKQECSALTKEFTLLTTEINEIQEQSKLGVFAFGNSSFAKVSKQGSDYILEKCDAAGQALPGEKVYKGDKIEFAKAENKLTLSQNGIAVKVIQRADKIRLSSSIQTHSTYNNAPTSGVDKMANNFRQLSQGSQRQQPNLGRT